MSFAGKIEEQLRVIGVHSVLGVDEAGMGCLAGPVVVGGVVLPPNTSIEGIKDSKKLSAKKRDVLAQAIYKEAVYASTVFVLPGVVDTINIRQAAMRGIVEVVRNAAVHVDMVVIDGTYNMDGMLRRPVMSVVKADASSINVAAASIIAKVARDTWMVKMSSEYPEYGWSSNKGYGTAKHIEAIKQHGCCPLHRKSFTVKGIRLDDLHS